MNQGYVKKRTFAFIFIQEDSKQIFKRQLFANTLKKLYDHTLSSKYVTNTSKG